MTDKILTLEMICNIVKPIAEKYNISEIYLFGSYARGEATGESDLDFLVYGGEKSKKTQIFALAEEFREEFSKEIDVFEIDEVDTESNFYYKMRKERVLVYQMVSG